MKNKIVITYDRFVKLAFVTFVFFLPLMSCGSSWEQLAPKSIAGLEIDFFIGERQNLNDTKNKIFYQFTFSDDMTYTMKTNSSNQKEVETERNGTYEYFYQSKSRSILFLRYINEGGEKLGYEMELEFIDLKSGIWKSLHEEKFHEATSGVFIIEKQGN